MMPSSSEDEDPEVCPICEEKNDPVQPQVCTAHDIWFGNCKVLVVVTTDLRLYNAFSHFIKLILGQEKPYDWM